MTSDGKAKLADFGVSFDRYGLDFGTLTEQARLEVQESRDSEGSNQAEHKGSIEVGGTEGTFHFLAPEACESMSTAGL